MGGKHFMPAANFSNRTVWVGDNLHVMRGINSACIDLIYLDPPFNFNQDYAAPIGSLKVMEVGHDLPRSRGGRITWRTCSCFAATAIGARGIGRFRSGGRGRR